MPTQRLNQYQRDCIYQDVMSRVKQAEKQEGMKGRVPGGRCLEVAWHGHQVLRSCPGAPRTIIQAGTAMWPRFRPEQDDGVSPTHFSYVWQGLQHAVTHCVKGRLPEMHVWLACPDVPEIVDLTTADWPEQCRRVIGVDWPGDRPPEYLWSLANRLPAGVVYRPDVEAIALVLELLRVQGRY